MVESRLQTALRHQMDSSSPVRCDIGKQIGLETQVTENVALAVWVTNKSIDKGCCHSGMTFFISYFWRARSNEPLRFSQVAGENEDSGSV